MCRGTILIYRCCGERRIISDSDEDRCTEEEIAHPSHRVMGRRVRLRLCNRCRRNREEEEQRYVEATGRAKALLEYLRGDREFPFNDEELARRQFRPRARETRDRILRAEDVTIARQLISELALAEVNQRVNATQPIFPSANSPPEEASHQAPLCFRDWSRENRQNVSDGTLDREIESYLEYLRGFPDINCPARFIAAAQEILRDAYSALEFVPEDETGHLMTFNTYIRSANPPIPETFGYFGQGEEAYASYLLSDGTLNHLWRFRNFRRNIGHQIRAYLNTLTPTGTIREERILTFREWTVSNIRVFDPPPSAEVQLRMDVNDYEHAYLGQRANAATLLEFRDLRDYIRTHDTVGFQFYPHTEGVDSFREWLSENIALTWHEALENYPLYLERGGHHQLVRRFEQARDDRAREDRRVFEGLPRDDPDVIPDPLPSAIATSEWHIGYLLIDLCFRFAAQLSTSRQHLPTLISVALLTLGRLVHRYRTATSAGRHLSLDEWDSISIEIREIAMAFSLDWPQRHPLPSRPAQLAQQAQDLADDLVSPISFHENHFSSEPSRAGDDEPGQLFDEPEPMNFDDPPSPRDNAQWAHIGLNVQPGGASNRAENWWNRDFFDTPREQEHGNPPPRMSDSDDEMSDLEELA